MHLMPQSDLALRLLMLLARQPDETVDRIAARYRVSPDRLMRVSRILVRAGFIEEWCDGMRLAKPAAHIDLGAVLRAAQHGCGMQIVTADGGRREPFGEPPGFAAALDGFSLADLMDGAEAQQRAGETRARRP
jgi:DNA-binding IscR family transcriptional regulator